MPTILELIGVPVPHGVDGQSLVPLLKDEVPEGWRSATFSELDFGDPLKPTVWQRQLGLALEAANLAVLRTGRYRLVQFAADLPSVLFDMDEMGESRDIGGDSAALVTLLDLSRRMLRHRMVNAEGTFARTMITSEGVRVA